jgi:hypothetical protein
VQDARKDRLLGHASIAITKDAYGHLLEGDERAATESMSRALFARWLPAWLLEGPGRSLTGVIRGF